MVATAAAQPDRLVVGVDANAAGMATASRRAAAKPSRGGLPNALFVVAAAEAMPAELDRVADLVTVHFPWGSLLRGLLGADPATMTGLTRVQRPGASLQLLVSSTDHDRGAGVPPIRAATLRALAASYAAWGLAVTELRPATVADVAAAHSTWAKRLGASSCSAWGCWRSGGGLPRPDGVTWSSRPAYGDSRPVHAELAAARPAAGYRRPGAWPRSSGRRPHRRPLPAAAR